MRPTIRSEIAVELLDTGRVQSFRVIDCHGHMGHFRGIYFPKPDAVGMVETLDRCGIEWLAFAHHDAMQDPLTGNKAAQEAIDAFPDRLLGYCAVNPNYPEDVKALVEGFGAFRGFAGYKILAGYYRRPVTHPACVPLWQHAHDNKLAVLLHTWGKDAFAGCEHVDQIAQTYPEARILMGHSQHGDWDGAIDLAKKHRNVYCELCAAYAVNGAVKRLVDGGVEDRILFGTDLPWFDPMHGIGAVAFADISDEARRRILRDNAEELFGRWLG